MDMIAKAFQREVGDLIRFNAKVTEIDQIDNKVIVTYIDELKKTNGNQVVKADWCLCTIPLSILSRLKKITVGNEMREAINAVPYTAAFKIGLQFKRRFWEEDDAIYGGISYTDLPINRIAYPSTRYGASGKSVLLGGYMFGPNAYEFTAMTPEDRIKWALAQGSKIHPQYQAEYDHTGISVGWHRNPGSMGCAGEWTEDARKKHYYNLCKEDRQIFIAGEHASDLPAWMEGALLSSLDAIERLHARASI
jgi:monoamine oxidase